MYCIYLKKLINQAKHIQVTWVQQEAGGLQVATACSTIYTNLVEWSVP